MARFTVIIRDGITADARKITKIVSLEDGGFSIFAPYHSAKTGYLLKLQSSLAPGPQKHDRKDNVEEFSASDLVKLSIHADGFTQFSSVNAGNIISGRDPNGRPRGLALFTEPLNVIDENQPIFSLTVWGLSDFATFGSVSGAEDILFDQNQIFTQPTHEHRAGAYLLEGFLIPAIRRAAVLRRSDGIWLPHTLKNYIPKPGKKARLGVIDFGNPEYFIGLLVTRKKHGFPSDSGYSLASPGEVVGRDGQYPIVRCIYATYPEIDWSPSGPQPTRSLDYARVTRSQDGS